MSTTWSVLIGFIVTIITYLFSQWNITGKWEPIGTSLKGLMAIGISFLLAVVQGLATGTFMWKDVWTSLPIIVGVAMGFYGVFVKPIDKAIKTPTTETILSEPKV